MTGRPIPGARIVVPDAAIEVVTDSSGIARMANLPLGSYMVEMLALGYMPMRQNVDITAGRDATIEFSTARRVPTLAEVTVRDRMTDPTGFWRRRSKGQGFFVDANQIRSWGAPSLESALANAPMLRGVLQGRGNCTPTFFVDAVRFDNAPASEMLVGLDIGGVEVYGNPADVRRSSPTPAGDREGRCCALPSWSGPRHTSSDALHRSGVLTPRRLASTSPACTVRASRHSAAVKSRAT